MISKYSWKDPRYSPRTKHWGLYDTRDHCWLGDPIEGPNTWVDKQYARIALAIFAERLSREDAEYRIPGRVKIKRFHSKGAWRKRDELAYARSLEDALKRLESGTVVPIV